MKEVSLSFTSRLVAASFVAALVGGGGVARAQGPPPNPFDQLSAEHAALATQIGDPASEAEMTTQHDMIKTDIADAQTAIQTDLATLQASVDALAAAAAPCGEGGQRFVPDDEMTPTEYCDNTTGLYWEASPNKVDTFTWDGGVTPSAIDYCTNLDLDNGLGQVYRLPEVKELISLVDYSVADQATALNSPIGPFSDVLSGNYWSASEHAGNPILAWYVSFLHGDVPSTTKTNFFLRAWCVR